jgi:hypothetical protein
MAPAIALAIEGGAATASQCAAGESSPGRTWRRCNGDRHAKPLPSDTNLRALASGGYAARVKSPFDFGTLLRNTPHGSETETQGGSLPC